MSGPHVFLAASPRHALLAAGVALAGDAPGDAHLYLVEHVPRADVAVWAALFEGWEDSPFRSVTTLAADWRAELAEASGSAARAPGAGRVLGERPAGAERARAGWRTKRAVKARLRRANAERLRADLERLRPETVWVGGDTYLEAQLALSLAKRLRPGARGAYLEDGTAAYARTFRESRASRLLGLRRAGDLAKRMTYGRFWRPAAFAGASSWIDEAWLAFPELALPELARKERRALSPEPFRGEEFRRLAASAARRFGGDPVGLADLALVLVLTRSTVARFVPGYVEGVTRLVEELAARGERVAVKLHPREPDPGFVPFLERPEVEVVPAALPFELLLALAREPGPAVVGDVSTGLLATRWIRPEALVVVLRSAPADTPAGRYLERELAALEVPVTRSPEEALRLVPEIAGRPAFRARLDNE